MSRVINLRFLWLAVSVDTWQFFCRHHIRSYLGTYLLTYLFSLLTYLGSCLCICWLLLFLATGAVSHIGCCFFQTTWAVFACLLLLCSCNRHCFTCWLLPFLDNKHCVHVLTVAFYRQQALFHILAAYSMYNTDVGYCQGMSQIAALLLMYMNEEASDAFYWDCVNAAPEFPGDLGVFSFKSTRFQ